MPVIYNPWHVREEAWGSSVPNVTTATHAAATLTYYSPGAPKCCGIYGVAWSYTGGTVTGGNIQMLDGLVVVFNQDIDLKGEGEITFPSPFIALPGNNLSFVLTDGGSGVVGRLAGISPFISKNYPADLTPVLDFSNPANSGLFGAIM